MDIPELIERVYALKNSDANALARRVELQWNEGVIPSQRELDRLWRYLRADGPCERLDHEGRCGDGWLRKHGAVSGIAAKEPWQCPFENKWRECPGYRKPEEI
jgi:hypothetical protein